MSEMKVRGRKHGVGREVRKVLVEQNAQYRTILLSCPGGTRSTRPIDVEMHKLLEQQNCFMF